MTQKEQSDLIKQIENLRLTHHHFDTQKPASDYYNRAIEEVINLINNLCQK